MSKSIQPGTPGTKVDRILPPGKIRAVQSGVGLASQFEVSPTQPELRNAFIEGHEENEGAAGWNLFTGIILSTTDSFRTPSAFVFFVGFGVAALGVRAQTGPAKQPDIGRWDVRKCPWMQGAETRQFSL